MSATNGMLLAGRVLLAACFLPSAVARLSNISGFAASLSAKGMPYSQGVAAAVTLAEVIGPLALVCGAAPRMSAYALIAATTIATGTLHRFWEVGGAAYQTEQALFMAQVAAVAGLLFYLIAGPGEWSWQAWWRGDRKRPKPATKKKSSRPRTTRPRPAPSRPETSDEELADAA